MVGLWVRHWKGRRGLTGLLKRLQIVHIHQSIAGTVVYAAHDLGVISGWQGSNDGGLAWLSGSMSAVLDFVNLVGGDDPPNYRGLS